MAEVNPETWRNLVQRKLKIGWQICNVEDFVRSTDVLNAASSTTERLTAKETKFCAGKHQLKECKATDRELKCANCITHNKHNTGVKIIHP